MKTQKGFTLIELLAVCAIIFMISSIVYANIVVEPRNQANDAHAQVEVAEVSKAIKTKAIDGNPPRNYIGGAVSTGSPGRTTPAREGTDSYNRSMQELVASKTYAEIPKSPDGKSYFYLYDEAKNEGIFGAILHSKKAKSSSGGGCITSNNKTCSVSNDDTDGDGEDDIIIGEVIGDSQIAGVCGSAHGQSYYDDATPEKVDLCSTGTAESFTLENNMWSWTCSGNPSASCGAQKYTVANEDNNEPTCGSATSNSYSNIGSIQEYNMCAWGSPGSPQVQGDKVFWYCDSEGFESAYCEADYNGAVSQEPPDCGSDHGQYLNEGIGDDLCVSGQPSEINYYSVYSNDTGGYYSMAGWTCSSVGFEDVSCSTASN